MAFRFRLQSLVIAIAMLAVVLLSLRMSVPEDKTPRGLIPFFGFALVGVWAAIWRRWNVVAGGVAGGVVGAIANTTAQYVYYRYFHSDWFANVVYLGPAACLINDLSAGSVIGLLLGTLVWVALRIGAFSNDHRPGDAAEN
jgi:hypothetical protein